MEVVVNLHAAVLGFFPFLLDFVKFLLTVVLNEANILVRGVVKPHLKPVESVLFLLHPREPKIKVLNALPMSYELAHAIVDLNLRESSGHCELHDRKSRTLKDERVRVSNELIVV